MKSYLKSHQTMLKCLGYGKIEVLKNSTHVTPGVCKAQTEQGKSLKWEMSEEEGQGREIH